MSEHLRDPAETLVPPEETDAPPPGILVSSHFKEPYGYAVNRTNGTRDWLITFTISGKGYFRVDEITSVCTADDIAILAPGTPHHYGTSEPDSSWEFVWAHFVPRSHWSRWLQLPEAAKGLIHFHVDDDETRQRILKAFDRVLHDSKGIGAVKEELALNALEEIVLLLAQKHSYKNTNAFDPRVEDVLHILTQQMSANHSVAELAAKVCVSPSRLAHIFKEQTGDSIMETLLKIRLRQAARLLEFTSRQVTEIAQDVGFHSLYYFSRQFANYFGMSPSQYRDRRSGYEQ